MANVRQVPTVPFAAAAVDLALCRAGGRVGAAEWALLGGAVGVALGPGDGGVFVPRSERAAARRAVFPTASPRADAWTSVFFDLRASEPDLASLANRALVAALLGTPRSRDFAARAVAAVRAPRAVVQPTSDDLPRERRPRPGSRAEMDALLAVLADRRAVAAPSLLSLIHI